MKNSLIYAEKEIQSKKRLPKGKSKKYPKEIWKTTKQNLNDTLNDLDIFK